MNKWRLYYKSSKRNGWAVHELIPSEPMRNKLTARTWLTISENAVFAENNKGNRIYPTFLNKLISHFVMLFD